MTRQASPPPEGDRPTPTAPSPPPRWRHWLWPLAALFTVLLFVNMPNVQGTPKMDLNYSQFLKQVDTGKVKTVTIKTDGQANGTLTNGHRYTVTIPVQLTGDSLLNKLQAKKVTITASTPSPSRGSQLLSWTLILAPMLIIGWLWWRMSKGAMAQMQHGALGGVGKSKAKVFDAERPKTGFADVAGYEGVKAEVAEVVDFLRRPERYHRAGASAPRGVLMVGPPGTGKTLIARAVAGEADVPFLSVAGSSFVEMYVGVGAARVRDLFAEARKRAPAIVFVDEIDALGGRRGAGQVVSNDEREQTLNQLLSEMDGFEGAEGIVVLAATNRPEVLDPALLRPGRFDRQVTVPLPTLAERTAILAVHCQAKQLDPDVDLDVVARGTPGFSGADLANLANEAAIAAVRDGREVIAAADFAQARDRILLGRREGSNVLLPAEKHAVAVHEAGHALVAALSPSADPVAKVTILPAGQTLGVTEQLPLVERHLYGEDYLTQTLAVRLGGRAAELVELGQGSTGAANDLAGATELATKMVREFGLSPALGPVGYPQGGSVFLGQGGSALSSRPFAEATQAAIDTEVARLLRDAEQQATGLLESHRDALRGLVELLLEQETVAGTAVYHLLGTKPPDEHAVGTTMAPRRVSVAKEPAAHRSGPGGSAAPASAGTAPAARKPEDSR